MDMRKLSSRVIQVIGLACPKLRVLTLPSPGTNDLAPTLENDGQKGLFQLLHTLALPRLETSSSLARYVDNIYALSNYAQPLQNDVLTRVLNSIIQQCRNGE